MASLRYEDHLGKPVNTKGVLMRLAFAAFCFTFSASSVFSAQVELDFDDIEILPNSLGLDGGFPGENYTLSGETKEFLDPALGLTADLNRISSNFTGLDTTVQKLTLSRSDGKNFNFEYLDVSSFYSGYVTEYTAVDDNNNFVRIDDVRTIFDIVQIEAINKFGKEIGASVVPADAVSVTDSNWGFFSTGKRIESRDLQGDFTDLVSLTFTSKMSPDSPEGCLPENLVRAEDFFSLFQPCGSLDSGLRIEFNTVGLIFPRNDGSFYSIASIGVSDNIAPVPVPSSLFFLSASLLFLGGIGSSATLKRV